VAAKKNRTAEIASEMTDILVGHLEAIPPKERKKRIKAFREVINRGAKRGHALLVTHKRATRQM